MLSTTPVLLVDDDVASLLALEATLEGLELEFVRATSGEDALARVREQPFAAVLLDVRMPGMDGLETVQRLRAAEGAHYTPVIFFTADDDMASRVDEIYRLGAVDLLVKPFNPLAVRAKVRALVTLFRENEHARREADEFRILVQGTTDYAIFLLDPSGRVMTWNPGAQRIKGYSDLDIIGKHFSTFYPQEAKDRGWPEEELRRATAEGRFEDEGWRVRKDGSLFWANVIITALRDEGGGLRGFSKVTRDLTERRQRDEELRTLHDALERRVEERTSELEASNRALQDADRRKDKFIALLAHELRNPLAPIRNGLFALRHSKVPGTSERMLAIMERQIGHLAHLVDGLLDVARLTQGRISLQKERTELGKLLGRAVEDHRSEFEAAGISLRVETPTSAWVDGDPTRLAQIVDNLLSNARKFTPRGGQVEVRLETTPSRQVVLRVKDTGVGIDPLVLPTLFESFFQVDQGLDRQMGGLGLGLSLVRGLATLHDGTVDANSAGLGQGAEFVVRFPQQDEPQALASVPSLPQSCGKRRVLIIEDNADSAQSLVQLLSVLGHEVRLAMTGPDGVEQADSWRPDVILCDIGLPGLDGYEVAKELHRRSVAATTQLIALTGYGSEEDRWRAKNAGFHHHVTKPADPDRLLQLLGPRKT